MDADQALGLRRALLGALLAKAQAGSASAGVEAARLLREIEEATAPPPLEVVDVSPPPEETAREFLQRQLRGAEADLEAARADGSIRALGFHRRTLLGLRRELAELDAAEVDLDPYAGQSVEETVGRVVDEVIPQLPDQVLLAAAREYGRRHQGRVEIISEADGSRLALLASGWGPV